MDLRLEPGQQAPVRASDGYSKGALGLASLRGTAPGGARLVRSTAARGIGFSTTFVCQALQALRPRGSLTSVPTVARSPAPVCSASSRVCATRPSARGGEPASPAAARRRPSRRPGRCRTHQHRACRSHGALARARAVLGSGRARVTLRPALPFAAPRPSVPSGAWGISWRRAACWSRTGVGAPSSGPGGPTDTRRGDRPDGHRVRPSYPPPS